MGQTLLYQTHEMFLWRHQSGAAAVLVLFVLKGYEKVYCIVSFNKINENGGIWILLMHRTAVHLFAFFSLNLSQVELELLALQDVAICPAALTWSGGNAGCRGVAKFSYIRIIKLDKLIGFK